jgi:type II secretory pathway pseudopilin PulG
MRALKPLPVPHARAFTLVEVITVVGVVALLAALVLPAVENAREGARRAQCLNNMRQLGVAIQSYHSLHGVFPAPVGKPSVLKSNDGRVIFSRQYSLFVQILAQLEQVPLYNSVNFDHAMEDPYFFAEGVASAGFRANHTAMATTLGFLLCPSDAATNQGWTGGSNYRANLGTDRWYFSTDGPFMDAFSQLSAAATTDGLSNTAAFSEKLRSGAAGGPFDPLTEMMVGGLPLPFTAIESAQSCRAQTLLTGGFIGNAGTSWFVGTLGQTCYNHVIPPNASIPDCVLPLSDPICGIVSARSHHPGGIHAMTADGAVRLVRETVGWEVWRALGSRSGGEIFSPGAY